MLAIVLAADGASASPLLAAGGSPSLLPVAGRPTVAHTVSAAVEAGAEEVVVVVDEDDGVRSAVGERIDGVPVHYERQRERAGTAEAARLAHRYIDGEFAVLNGDNLYDAASLGRMFDAGPSVGTHAVDEPSRYGVLSIEDGRVTAVTEKPAEATSRDANTGAYVFPMKARDWLEVPRSRRGERELTDVLARVIAAFELTPVGIDRWVDVSVPGQLLTANEWKLQLLESDVRGSVHTSAELDGPVAVGTDAVVESGTIIEGPVMLGAGARVGSNASIRGASFIGENARVGHAVEVENSVLLSGSAVGPLSYVADSILGEDVDFGAGSIVANCRHDRQPVSVTDGDERVSTGRRRFGVIAETGARTAVDTTVDAGVTLSARTRTQPGENVLRDR